MNSSQKEDKKETMMWGYRPDRLRTVLTWALIVCTAFLLRLFFHWLPHLFLKATHRECYLRDATRVLVKDEFGRYFVHSIHLCTVDGTENRFDSKVPFSRKVHVVHRSRHKNPISAYQMEASQHVEDEALLRYFTHKKLKYIWNFQDEFFLPLKSFDMTLTKDVHDMYPLTFVEANRRRVFYGPNVIDVPITPLLKVIVLQILNPFYVFQVFSCILWYFDQYWQYATCIVIESLLSISFAVFETRRNERSLRNTIESNGQVLVYRDGEYRELPSDLLVPGDVIEIPRNGCTMHCDAILLSGHAIVNESMLTGESVPVSKVPKPVTEDHRSFAIDMKEEGRHLLFSGTRVIQARNYEGEKVRALVLRTGFLTSKGELVRAIMFPKPMRYKFDRDILHYLIVLSIFAAIGFVLTIAIMVRYNKPAGLIALRALDLITVVVPPALPAAMSVGLVFSLRRLKKNNNIYCIAPNSINVCGSVDLVAFDKTGTITEEGLDLRKVLYCDDNMSELIEEQNPQRLDSASALVSCMASAHSLAYIEGEICGDPIDLKMFEAIGWRLEEPQVGRTNQEGDTVQQMVPRVVTFQDPMASSQSGLTREIGLLREFPFSSTLQRMAVLGRVLGESHFTLFVKGSPEMIRDLSLQQTVPSDLERKLENYTLRGYRVLALAWRKLPKLSLVRVHRVSREEVEKELNFAGLLVMENRLKSLSKPTIWTLKAANIRTVMVTGDNILTALSVAHDCCLLDPSDRVIRVHTQLDDSTGELDVRYQEVDDAWRKRHRSDSERSSTVHDSLIHKPPAIHLALTGREWHEISKYRPQIIPKLALLGSVFARFSPEQKAEMIVAQQELGHVVSMCGDGANDCGALKAAHAGISLSEAEASVASPFTSKRHDISCVPALIREGRCALVTSFGIFKYMAAYSLTQFITVLLLYYMKLSLTDAQFLYIDLVTITSLSITFGNTYPAEALHPIPPPHRLISIPTIFSLLGLQVVNMGILLGSLQLTRIQSWFHDRNEQRAVVEEDYASYENTVLFIVSSFQYITFAYIFAKGYPYRRGCHTNIFFSLNLFVLTVLTIYVALGPFKEMRTWLEMVEIPQEPRQSLAFRFLLVGFAAANFFLCYFIETALDSIFFRRVLHLAKAKGWLPNKRPPFVELSERLSESAWPEIELDRRLCHCDDWSEESDLRKDKTAQITVL